MTAPPEADDFRIPGEVEEVIVAAYDHVPHPSSVPTAPLPVGAPAQVAMVKDKTCPKCGQYFLSNEHLCMNCNKDTFASEVRASPRQSRPSVTGIGGYWMEFDDIDICKKGEVQTIWHWVNETTIEDMKVTVEEHGWSAITISKGKAVLKNFEYQLTPQHCRHISTCCCNPCKIYIYTRPENAHRQLSKTPPLPKSLGLLGGSPSVTGRAGFWIELDDMDMCEKGDVKLIEDWMSWTTIDEMKRLVEKNHWSAITVSTGKPAFSHAAIKNFDFQLLPCHCRHIDTCCRQPCKIFIYIRAENASYMSAYDIDGTWCDVCMPPLACVCSKRLQQGPDAYMMKGLLCIGGLIPWPISGLHKRQTGTNVFYKSSRKGDDGGVQFYRPGCSCSGNSFSCKLC
eukprot:TRINITY_DN18234_c0_g1_i1.p1 TRINITY_DN18234_c0_g1~~TRINITY_DN18234_c0_g1_i1.p1  ORF type:complete len:397 (+),score=39.63 TRINITY_DN18234_c0_g1_i1:83-1273(+)